MNKFAIVKFVIVVFTVLCSCSPQKRLARIIALHPELQQTETITLRDTIIHTKVDTLLRFERVDSGTVQTQTVGNTTITLTGAPDNTIGVRLQRVTDTTVVIREHEVPVYLTHTVTETKEVYKQKPWQSFLSGIGILAIILLFGYLLANFIRKYI